ncbi:MAG: VWA domain-containing protein [Spirochaetales bacterium]|nr:VWA domain-containing protein [Spirochaetales bacterium]
MKQLLPILVMCAGLAPVVAWAGGAAEAAAGSSGRGSYLAERGVIVPPEEVHVDSYVAAVDYHYPQPDSLLGVSLYSGCRQLSTEGQEEVFQIGIQGGKMEFQKLTPMNLAFVIDHSGSMADADKLDWVKDAFDIFIERVRPVDYVSLVIFSSGAEVVFPATRMSSAETRERFRRAVHSISPAGSTNIRDGLELGCLEVMKNLSREYTNRVMFLSDGCDTCGNSRASILEVARGFSAQGVSISTIGVGQSFDLELMVQMGKVGEGSSRFISDREEMEKTFGSELDRMVVALARNVEMTLEFLVDVDVLDTWGYENRRSGNTIRYYLPTLHHGDYETILAQVRVHPQRFTGPADVARFTVRYEDVYGKSYQAGPYVLQASFVEGPPAVVGFSDAVVLHSGTMLHFAQSLKAIGELYYSGEDPARLREAFELALAAKKEIVNARVRLDDRGFDKPIAILDNYVETLGRELQIAEEQIRRLGQDMEIRPPVPQRSQEEHFAALCREIALDLRGRPSGVVAVGEFASQGAVAPGLAAELSDLVYVEVARVRTLRVIPQTGMAAALRDRSLDVDSLTDKVSALEVGRSLNADYILTGTVLEMAASYVVFSRLLNVGSGEVESAAQVIVAK